MIRYAALFSIIGLRLIFHPVHTEKELLPFESNTSNSSSVIITTATPLINIKGDKATEIKPAIQIKTNKSATRFDYLKTKHFDSVI